MDTSQYLPMFLAECRENLQELNLAVVRLEDDPSDRETIDAIFRIAHSLKGMSATMGFEGMAHLTHEMENVLELLRQRGDGLTEETVDVLLACLDALSGATDAIESGGTEEIEPGPLVERLKALVRDSDQADADLAAEDETPPPPVLVDVEGRRVLEITATLAPEAMMPSVRAFQVLNALAEHGELISSTPPEAEVDGFAGREISALLVSDHEADVVAAAVRGVSDIADAQVAESAAPAPAEPAPLAPVVVAEPAVEVDGEAAVEELAALAVAPDAPKADDRKAAAAPKQHQAAATVRVDADRLDQLMHFMGELVVQRTHVEALAQKAEVPGLTQAMQELTRSSHALQTMVMQIRMIPVEAVFLRFPRLVRDASSKLAKQVDLQLVGQETELDRTVVDALGDPLVHLIRNSLDHGLETPAERRAAGKPETGTLTIAARHAGGNIVISVADDGRGVNPEKVAAKAVERGLITRDQAASVDVTRAIELLFSAGFSTSETVGDLSGRGVGMDAVRAKIRQLGGEVFVTSTPGEGTVAEIRLPLTLAIMNALLVEADGLPYGIPLSRVERTMRLDDQVVRSVAGERMLVLEDEAMPLVRAGEAFGHAPAADDTHVVIVRGQDRSIALAVSGLIGQRELVTRPLPAAVTNHQAVSGAAVLSNGDIVLLADCDALIAFPDHRRDARPRLAAVA